MPLAAPRRRLALSSHRRSLLASLRRSALASLHRSPPSSAHCSPPSAAAHLLFVHSDSASVIVPVLDLDVTSGTLGGIVTTVEGLITKFFVKALREYVGLPLVIVLMTGKGKSGKISSQGYVSFWRLMNLDFDY